MFCGWGVALNIVRIVFLGVPIEFHLIIVLLIRGRLHHEIRF